MLSLEFLVRLNLSNNNLGDDGARTLSASVAHNVNLGEHRVGKVLKHLGLSGNGITSAGFSSLVQPMNDAGIEPLAPTGSPATNPADVASEATGSEATRSANAKLPRSHPSAGEFELPPHDSETRAVSNCFTSSRSNALFILADNEDCGDDRQMEAAAKANANATRHQRTLPVGVHSSSSPAAPAHGQQHLQGRRSVGQRSPGAPKRKRRSRVRQLHGNGLSVVNPRAVSRLLQMVITTKAAEVLGPGRCSRASTDYRPTRSARV